MGKEIFSICIDSVVRNRFATVVGKGNVSKEISKFMESYVGVGLKKEEQTKLQLEQELQKNKDALQKMALKVSNSQAQLEYMEKLESDERLRLAEEVRARELEARKCSLCKNVIPEGSRSHILYGSIVCNACFLSADRAQLSKLKQEAEENEQV